MSSASQLTLAPPETDALSTDGWRLPRFDVHAFQPRRSKYCVCVFVINEGERIRRQLAKMKPLAEYVDIVVADGGSTDGSLDSDYLSAQRVRALLVKRSPGKLSTQMRMGLAWALMESYAGVIVMDGNNKDDPAAIERLAAALDAGYDHVQGSRFVRGGRAINTPLLRHLAIRLLHAPLISLAARFRYTDTTNGFRAYSRRLLVDPEVAPFRDIFAGYELHYYLAIRAPRLGYRTVEVPVTRAYPPRGQVPTKIAGLGGWWRLFRTVIAACLGRFNPSRDTADGQTPTSGGFSRRPSQPGATKMRAPGRPAA